MLGEVSELRHMEKGVRKGCVLSLAIKKYIRDLGGIKIGSHSFISIKSEEKLHHLDDREVDATEWKGLELNASGTTVMIIPKTNKIASLNIRINGERL